MYSIKTRSIFFFHRQVATSFYFSIPLWQYSNRELLTGAKISILDQYLVLGLITTGLLSVKTFRRWSMVIALNGGILSQETDDTAPYINESCLWQQVASVYRYTEENRKDSIVRSGKSEAEVTNNKRLHSRYIVPFNQTTDTKHCTASLQQQSFLLVIIIICRNSELLCFLNIN